MMVLRVLIMVVAVSLPLPVLAKSHGGKRFLARAIDNSIISSGGRAMTSLKNNLAKTIVAGGLAVTLACGVGGLSGCSSDDGSVSLVLVTDDYRGQHVYLTMDGLIYQGLVVGGVSNTGIEIVLDNGNSLIVDKGLVDGVLVPNHPDIGGEVYLYGDPNSNIEFFYAIVNRVYDNSTYELLIDSEVDYDGNIILLAEPYTLLVSSRLTLEDGGFEFFD